MNELDYPRGAFLRTIVLQNLLAMGFYSVLGPMVIGLSTVFFVSITDIGLLNSIFLLVSAISCFAWAVISERFKRKTLMIICAMIWSICSLLTIFSLDFTMFLFFQIIAAIGFGGILPISYSLLMEFTNPNKRTYTLGILQMGLTLGTGFGILLGGILIDLLPFWGFPFLIISLLAFINLIFIFKIIEPERGLNVTLFSEDQPNSPNISFTIKLQDFKEIIKIKSNFLIFCYTLIKSLSVGAINFYFISMMIVDHGFSSSLATILMVMIFSAQIIGSPYLGKIADKQYMKKKTGKITILILLLLIGPLAYIFGFSLNFQIDNLLLITLFLIIICIGAFFLSADSSISQSIISDSNLSQIRATVFSIQYISSIIGQSIGIIILGSLYNLYGSSFINGYVIISLILMSSVIFIIPLRKTFVSDLNYLKKKYKE